MLMDAYLDHLRLERKAANTIDSYKYHLTTFLSWVYSEGYELGQMKPMDMLDFKECLLRQNKSERTINAFLSCLKGYFDYLILNEIAKANPVTSLLRLKVPHYKQGRLTDQQLLHFYGYIDGLRPNVRAAFYLMLGSGVRVSEVTNLTKADFSFEDGQLYIDIKNAKWKSDRRIPVVDRKAAQIVAEYVQSLDVTSQPAFRMSKRTIQTYASNFTKRYGIPFHCHVLRHTFATLLMEQGVTIEKIQFLLGHQSAIMTRHYTQSAFVDVSKVTVSFNENLGTSVV